MILFADGSRRRSVMVVVAVVVISIQLILQFFDPFALQLKLFVEPIPFAQQLHAPASIFFFFYPADFLLHIHYLLLPLAEPVFFSLDLLREPFTEHLLFLLELCIFRRL